MIEEKLITARGVYGFFPANAVGDDVELYADELAGRSAGAVAFSAPAGESGGQRAVPFAGGLYCAEGNGACGHIGAFAVTSGIGLKELSTDSGRSTTITTRSWRRRWPIGWRRRLRNACTSGCARSGATAATSSLSPTELIAREVSWDSAGGGLPGVPGPYGEGHAVAAARRRGEDRHAR